MKDKILYGYTEDAVFVKITGDATMKNSRILSVFLEKVFREEKKNLVFEMSECCYLDSTFLGLIAKSALEIRKKWQSVLYVMNPSNMVLNGLKQTGIDKFLEKIEDNSTKVNITELEVEDFGEKKEKTLHILEMHKTLMDLNEKNKETFKNVVGMMENSLNE